MSFEIRPHDKEARRANLDYADAEKRRRDQMRRAEIESMVPAMVETTLANIKTLYMSGKDFPITFPTSEFVDTAFERQAIESAVSSYLTRVYPTLEFSLGWSVQGEYITSNALTICVSSEP